MAFQHFKAIKGKREGTPAIKVYPNRITLNAAARDMLGFKQKEYVSFYIDREKGNRAAFRIEKDGGDYAICSIDTCWITCGCLVKCLDVDIKNLPIKFKLLPQKSGLILVDGLRFKDSILLAAAKIAASNIKRG